MNEFWGIVIVLVALGICWGIVQYWRFRPKPDGLWALLEFAAYAVSAAREVTGSSTNAELGEKALAYMKQKYPKAPDVDLEVAIAKALDELEKKPAPILPAPDPATVDSADILA